MTAREPGLYALDTVLQHYAWGSRHAIAAMAGRPTPSVLPEAELWVGAHPQGPSRVRAPAGPHAGETLASLVDAQPELMLGPQVQRDFGARLPLLLKLLAAAQPLSLQAHPSLEQAARGFAREEAAQIDRRAPQRLYRDRSHKPELLCALTPFDALCGFRPHDELFGRVLAVLDVAPYRAKFSRLEAERSDSAMRATLETLLRTPHAQVAALLPQLLDKASMLAAHDGPDRALGEWLHRIAEVYGPDPGVLIVPMMNLLRLEPGQAVFLDAGNLHAYLQGTGVEVMANSDNVLRGGLTPKHVDVDELLRVLDARCAPVSPVSTRLERGAFVYETPAREFELLRYEAEPGATIGIELDGPELLLCTRGTCEVRAARGGDGARLRLAATEAAAVAHGCGAYELASAVGAQVFRARVPRGPGRPEAAT